MLESKGVIESVGNGSFAVAGYANPLNSSLQLLLSLDQATMLDIYELRRILECEAAGLAAERHGEAHLAVMDSAIADHGRRARSARARTEASATSTATSAFTSRSRRRRGTVSSSTRCRRCAR